MKNVKQETIIDASVSNLVNQLLALITRKAASDSTVVIKVGADNGELFGKEITEKKLLEPGWAGWKEYLILAKHNQWFNDFGYFDAAIEQKQITTIEQGITLATELSKLTNDIYMSAKDNGSYQNSLVLVLGLDSGEIQAEFGEQFLSMLERVYRVGKASAKQDALAALKRKALKGDLNAQKTILLHEGELSAENAKASSAGTLTIVADDADRNL